MHLELLIRDGEPVSAVDLELDRWPIIADGRTSSLISGRFLGAADIPCGVMVKVASQQATVLGPHLRVDARAQTYSSFIAEIVLSPAPVGTEFEILVDVTLVSGRSHRLKTTMRTSEGLVAIPIDSVARVTIAMATYNPAPEVIARQIRSIKAQSFEDWVCIVQDDRSRPDRLASIAGAIDGDSRFHLAVNETNRGFYGNFEAALARVPRATEFVALSDQDDFWHTNKLTVLVDDLTAHTDAELAYSDLRVVNHDGEERTPSFSAGRASLCNNANAVLVANVVTGCSAMFRASLLDLALPFPRAGRVAYHDHWLAYCAASCGVVRYIEEPLADYYQHANNVLGARGSDRLRFARLILLAVAVPAVILAGTVARTRRLFRRVFSLMLNQAAEEYAVRLAFASTLSSRIPHLAGGLARPATKRERWLIGRLILGARFGIGHWTVGLRLLAGAAVERGIRSVELRASRGPKRLGLRG